jgi:hypothetical protein
MLAAALVTLLGVAGCAGTPRVDETPAGGTPSFVAAVEPTPAVTGTPRRADFETGTGTASGKTTAPGTGTGTGSGTGATATAGPSGRRPASAAGGACRRLTFERVRRVLGVDFQVAASGGTATTSQTCVLQQVAEPESDLLLTVTPAPGVTATTFGEHYVPSGGTALRGVGKAAYRVVVRAPGSATPRVEIGWLGAAGQILTLARTLGADENPNLTRRVVERLALLAAQVDR